MASLSGAGSGVNSYDPIDFRRLADDAVGFGTPTTTAFTLRDLPTNSVWTFTGSGLSAYFNGFPNAGTITGVNFTRGSTTVSISGFSLDALTALQLIDGNNFDLVLLLIFAGADTFAGTAFDDTLDGNIGNDTLLGGDGDDRLSNIAAVNNGMNAGVDTFDGGAGTDFLELFRNSSSVGFTIDTAQLRTAAGATLADGTVIRNVEGFSFFGGSGNDTLIIDAPGLFGSFFEGGAGLDTFVANFSASSENLRFGSSSGFTGYNVFDVERLELTTGSGNDSINAGDGDDRISGGGGADFLNGGGGADTIFGGDGRDVIFGGDGADSLFGDGGDDFFEATPGGFIDGGAGVDTIRLNFSTNVSNIEIAITTSGFSLTGASFNAVNVESLSGGVLGSGDDTYSITGNPRSGDSILNGGAGNDLLSADFRSEIFGISLNEFDFSTDGLRLNLSNLEQFRIIGGLGDDTLSGGVGDDTLDGGAGDDFIGLTAGRDIVLGGGGDDRFSGALIEQELIDGGAGVDFIELNFFDATSAMTFDFSELTSAVGGLVNGATVRNFESFTVVTGAGNDVFRFNSVVDENFVIAGDGVDSVLLDLSASTADFYLEFTGRSFRLEMVEFLTILGGSGDEGFGQPDMNITIVASGGAGNDGLRGGNLNDTLDGGSGNDFLGGGAGTNSLTGGTGDDFINSDGGPDLIDAGDGDDFVFAGGGNDGVLGGDGLDLIDGFDGNDTLSGGAGADTLNGGSGFDLASYATADARVRVDLANGSLNTGDAAGDVFDLEIEAFEGSAFNDSFGGDSGANLFFGLAGADTLLGRAGNDTLVGGAGADSINGGDGFDIASYGGAAAAIRVALWNPSLNTGDASGDIIQFTTEAVFGSRFADNIQGNDQANNLRGGDGGDLILGGFGNDTAVGGAGADDMGGGAGFDVVSYVGGGAVRVALWNPAFHTGDAAGDNIRADIEVVEGSLFNDTLEGSAVANNLRGSNGNDRILGGGGADTLSGDLGNDTLDGGLGDDSLIGGGASDTFAYASGGGADVIADFLSGTSVIDVVRLTSFGAAFDSFAEVIAAATQNGANVVIAFGAGQSLTLQNIALADLDADDFAFG